VDGFSQGLSLAWAPKITQVSLKTILLEALIRGKQLQLFPKCRKKYHRLINHLKTIVSPQANQIPKRIKKMQISKSLVTSTFMDKGVGRQLIFLCLNRSTILKGMLELKVTQWSLRVLVLINCQGVHIWI
jgi:hypothetical protein